MMRKLMRIALLVAAMVFPGCGGTEAAPTCADFEKNGTETDVDCGGPSCGRCFDGLQCGLDSDCFSGRCSVGRCYSAVNTTGGGTGGGATGGGTGGGGGGTGGGTTGGGTGGGTTGGGTGGGTTGGGAGGGATGGGTGGGTTGGGTGGGAMDGGTGGGTTGPDRLIISQVQTRGDTGGNDEFVELHNPGNGPVIFDNTWTLAFRSAVGTCSTNTESTRYTGAGQIIPARGYLLITNTGYDGLVASDGTYSSGLVDSGSLVLRHNATTASALCFHFDATTFTALTTCAPAFVCEGSPSTNPHNNLTTSNTDTGLKRVAETQNNLTDFTSGPSTPRNLLTID
jgi:hypothetical protein